jgi:hypothetical protein
MFLINHFIKKLPDDSCGLKIYFDILKNDFTPKNKMNVFHKVIVNPFLSEKHKNIFIDFFYLIQKYYHGFKKLCRIVYTKQVVDQDLNFNSINKKDKNIIEIIHNNKFYLFNIIDLIKIAENSLTNNNDIFSEPQEIRNPYDNKPFEKHNLYNIYFFIKFHTHFHSELFHKFWLEHFCLEPFLKKYEYLLREVIIKNYIYKNSDDIIIKEIKEMILDFNELIIYRACKISIHQEFPKKKLLKVFKPYLYLYFQSKYSLVALNRTFNHNKFISKMKEFQKYNKQFGRKIIKMDSSFDFKTQQIIKTWTSIFNEDYIKYNDDFTPTPRRPRQIINYSYLALNNHLFDNDYSQIMPDTRDLPGQDDIDDIDDIDDDEEDISSLNIVTNMINNIEDDYETDETNDPDETEEVGSIS